jgi:hypothetical protein
MDQFHPEKSRIMILSVILQGKTRGALYAFALLPFIMTLIRELVNEAVSLPEKCRSKEFGSCIRFFSPELAGAGRADARRILR